MKIFTSNNVNIAYKIIGNGVPLVLIMGYGADYEIWPPKMIDYLSQFYKLILFNNRGFDTKPDYKEEYSIELFAHDTIELLDYLKIDNACLLGYSMGASIALETALNFPEKVNKLVLLSTDSGGTKAIRGDIKYLQMLIDNSGTAEEKVERMLKVLFPLDWLDKNPDLRSYMPEVQTKPSPLTLNKQVQAIIKWQGVYDRLENFAPPSLIITGNQDLIVPYENSIMLAEKIPLHCLVSLPGGHGVMWQIPVTIATFVKNFIDTDF